MDHLLHQHGTPSETISGVWSHTSASIPLLTSIFQALGELKAGQVLNRKTAGERVSAMRDHLDARINDLKQDVHRRMDSMEERLIAIETRPESSWSKEIPTWNLALGAVAMLFIVAGHASPEVAKGIIVDLIGKLFGAR